MCCPYYPSLCLAPNRFMLVMPHAETEGDNIHLRCRAAGPDIQTHLGILAYFLRFGLDLPLVKQKSLQETRHRTWVHC